MRHDKDSAGIVAAHIMRVCLYACTEGGGGGGGSGGCGSGGMEALGKQHMAHRMLALRYSVCLLYLLYWYNVLSLLALLVQKVRVLGRGGVWKAHCMLALRNSVYLPLLVQQYKY